MQIRLVEKPVFQICGYSVETSLSESGQDVAALYSDCFSSDKASAMDVISKDATAYYGLMWYLEGHERYRYLLGRESANLSALPTNIESKDIPAARYAVASLEKNYDAMKAWTEFFFEAILHAGYAPDYKHGFFFEYYPDGVDGDYELWIPVVKVDE